jgi:uncharacterized protein with HEPN domain
LTGPEREYADYLRDILDAAGKAGEFVGEMDAAAFEADDKTVFAVIRALEIVGEVKRQSGCRRPFRSAIRMYPGGK